MTTALEGCNRLHALGQAIAVLACQGEVAGCLADAPAVPAVRVGASLAQVLVQVQVAPLVGALSTPLQTRTFTCTACSGDVNFQRWHSLDCITEFPDKVVKGRRSSPTSTMHLQKRRGRGYKSWSRFDEHGTKRLSQDMRSCPARGTWSHFRLYIPKHMVRGMNEKDGRD